MRLSGRGIPLSLVIVRYFIYVIVAVAAVWMVSFMAISMAINAGAVYPASYGAGHVDETVEALRFAPEFDPDAVPTAYRYLRIDDAGAVIDGDVPDEDLESALSIAREHLGEGGTASEQAAVIGKNGMTYTVFGLPDGSTCLLASEFMPQFTSRELRDVLPNPQNIMLVVACAGSIASILLISHRASRVIARKMAPLTGAAERIAQEDLDFTVGSSNVRQVNEVLEAMERMRSSLKESLEARWRAEQAQRNQVAALAHDLKTPLTVVRANADYVAEETCGLAGSESASASGELEDVAAAARDIAAAAERLDEYVRLLIEASHGEAAVCAKAPVPLDSFADELKAEAAALARTAGIELGVACSRSLAGACAEADREALRRAVMNVVANALDHACGRIDLSFELDEGDASFAVAVDDDGPGFSAEALERGCERFFRGDSSRSAAASVAHYGIGLSTASEAVHAHGGTVELANRTDEAGRVVGARVIMSIPCSSGGSASGVTS